jgi:hypothetical protein
MYMHLSPGAGREAIDLLMVYRCGSTVAAESGDEKKASNSGK